MADVARPWSTALLVKRQLSALSRLWDNRSLIKQLVVRDIASRYRGSTLGTVWALLTPLLMLAIFTWVFGSVFHSRWPQASTNAVASAEPAAAQTNAEFAVILFAGLIVYTLFSEVVSRAPGLILANVNYVKKVVFPLDILPIVAIGSSLFNAVLSLGILLLFKLIVFGTIPPTALYFPLVLAPMVILLLGLAWFLSSFGVYLRDTSQILGPVLMALMFVSPIFYPASALPEWVRAWLFLNPLSLPIEQARDVLIWGRSPNWLGLGVYTIVAFALAVLGHTWFEMTRKGFADVL